MEKRGDTGIYLSTAGMLRMGGSGGIKARPGSLSVLSVLRLGRGLKSIKEQPGSFFAIFRKFLGRVLFFDKTQPAM